jgi:hypothetical protein
LELAAAFVGALGTVDGVAAFEAPEATEIPLTLLAVTLKVYAVPLVSPETVQLRGPLVHEQVAPPGEAVTL